jgi:pseudouridine-5'-phosphate glycosidase
MNRWLYTTPEVQEALENNEPVVALESALITHGFGAPDNLKIAQQLEQTVREAGACPATVAVLDGLVHVGVSESELERLASDREMHKISLRDLPHIAARGLSGGTTVAASIHLAHQAGVRVFASGGIGGIHRDHPEDVSADLPALANTPLIAVCAGAKSILDLPRTLQYLETHGVPVIGYGTHEFPAFYSLSSGLPVDTRVDSPASVARIAQGRTALGLKKALLVCVPVPQEHALPWEEAEAAIEEAIRAAERNDVTGNALTPFLLDKLVALTDGRSQRANEALLLNNAQTAAHIAQAVSRR